MMKTRHGLLPLMVVLLTLLTWPEPGRVLISFGTAVIVYFALKGYFRETQTLLQETPSPRCQVFCSIAMACGIAVFSFAPLLPHWPSNPW